MAAGAVLVVAWCGANLAALAVPAVRRPTELLAATLVLAAGSLLSGPRANAMTVALAPAATRGRYLAAFQYAFTVPGVFAPAVAGWFPVAVWLPWLVVAHSAGTAALFRTRLSSHVDLR